MNRPLSDSEKESANVWASKKGVPISEFWRELHPTYKIPVGYRSVWVLIIESLTHYNGPAVITVKAEGGRLMVREAIPAGFSDRDQADGMGWLAGVVKVIGKEVSK